MDPSKVVNPIPINPKSALISLTDFEKTVNSQQPINVLPIFASPQSIALAPMGNLIPFNFASPPTHSVNHGMVPPVSASPPPRKLKKTTVFWDFENITIPKFSNEAVEALVSALRTYLQNNNCQLTKIHAIGDVNKQLPEATQEFMKRNAISLHHVPQERMSQNGHLVKKANQSDFVIINELFNFVLDHPPPNNHNLSILILSSDTDFSMFASTLLNKGYEVHIIYKPTKSTAQHTNLPNSIKYVTWDKIRELMGDFAVPDRPPREERHEHTRSHSREREFRTPNDKKREQPHIREEDTKRGKKEENFEKVEPNKKEADNINNTVNTTNTTATTTTTTTATATTTTNTNTNNNNNKEKTVDITKSPTHDTPAVSKKEDLVPKNFDLKIILPDSTLEKARSAKGYQGVIDCLCAAHKDGTSLTTEDFLRDLKNFRVFWLPSSLASAEEEGIITIQNNEVHLRVDLEKVKQCKAFVDRAKKFVGLLYNLKVNPSVDLLKIELDVAECKLPWAQSAALLRSDFEVSQNTIHLKSGAPPKESLANLDPSLVQDSHWEVLSEILENRDFTEFTNLMELLTHLEARSKTNEPANVWFSLLLAAFERSWLQVEDKAIRPVHWTVHVSDNQYSALPTNTSIHTLKTMLAESLGKELIGSMYYGENRIASSKTLEVFIQEPYSLTPGSEIELTFKEKSDSSKKRKSQETEEKSTKKQSKSKN